MTLILNKKSSPEVHSFGTGETKMSATTISSPKESNSSEDKKVLTCTKCKSKHIKKIGFRTTQKRGKQQRYLCFDCGSSFTENKGFWRMKNNEDKICQAIDTYFEGLSLRKVKRNFLRYGETEISHQSILNWIRKYSYMIRNYVGKLNVNLEGHYLTDETIIHCAGDKHNVGLVLDKKTRYVVATRYSEYQFITPEDNVLLWNEAKKVKRPYKFTSDAHMTYHEAFNKVFWTRYKQDKVEYEQINFHKTGRYNYIMERVWNTLKERIKIMRGFKASWSAKLLIDGFFIWYNMIRPHMSFKRTPAENVGLTGLSNYRRIIELSVA